MFFIKKINYKKDNIQQIFYLIFKFNLMQKIICCNILDKNNDIMYHKIKKEGTLFDLRNSLEKRRNFKLLFFLKENGNYFTKEEEKHYILKSENINFTNINTIKINLDNKFLCYINLENISLKNLRIQLDRKITLQHKFFFNNAFILDERHFKVFDICKNNIIEMNKISKEIFDSLKEDNIYIDKELNDSKEINNINKKKIIKIEDNEKCELFNNLKNNRKEPFKLIYQNQEINNNIEKDINSKTNMSKIQNNIKNNNLKRYKSIELKKRNGKIIIKYNLIFNGEIKKDFPFLECSPDLKLSQIKEILPLKYRNYIFLYDGYPIYSEETNISEIAKNNKVYLKNEEKIPNNLNKILSGCQKLNENSIYEYYLYSNTKFNEQEEKDCISLLLLGETGAGKTTFLNSLINFILKVEYFDYFRYLLVKEEGSDNSLSQTKEVNIYHIKSHNSYPPIKIIDTPGFGDTSGYDFDKKITRMIFDKFKEIKDLNAVCFICKYNEVRFNFSQRYIFNYIIDLFGKDMAENFLVLFSFCDVGKILSKNCFEDKDSPFYKIINKVKEPWYLPFNNSGFFSEKKNEIIEEFYKMGNESFIQLIYKLKSLKKVKLALSSEVNIKREKLDIILSYINKKIIDLANLLQINNYSYSAEKLYFYYCNKCKFFSDNNKCIICQQALDINYGNKYFNFIQYSQKGNNLLLKYYLEIYSNLFQLENIMKEYNNITLKDSQETVKAFLYKILNENYNNKQISQEINEIVMKYKEYINAFSKQINKQNDFSLYLFNQLIK